MTNPDLINLTPNPFASVTDSTNDDEIIDLALSFMKEGNLLCFFDFIGRPFTDQKAQDLQDIMKFSKLADTMATYGTGQLTFSISSFGKEVLRNDGWVKYKKEQESTKQLNDTERLLKIENLKLSNDNLKYQNDIKELNTKNLELSIENGRLDKKIKIYTILMILLPILVWIVDHYTFLKSMLNLIIP